MTNKRALECRLKDFLAINHTKSVLLSEENEYLSFQKIKRLTKAAFIIYGDFKCVIIPSTDNINFGGSTKKCQDHIACMYGYKSICANERYSKPYKTYFGKVAIDKLLNNMLKENEYCSEVIEAQSDKPHVMTEKDHKNF